ncbi:MAG: site-specific integrase [Rhodoplanes sp.]
MPQIEAAAAKWARPKGRRWARPASRKARVRFISGAVRWFEFLGWIKAIEQPRNSGGAEIAEFEAWLRSDRGLSKATIDSYRMAADRLFVCLARHDVPLASVNITDIDDAIAAEKARGTCNRRTIHDYAQRVRAFFRFAEARGWCAQGFGRWDHGAALHARRRRAQRTKARRGRAALGCDAGQPARRQARSRHPYAVRRVRLASWRSRGSAT